MVTQSNDGNVGKYLIQVAREQASLWGVYTWYNGPLAGLGSVPASAMSARAMPTLPTRSLLPPTRCMTLRCITISPTCVRTGRAGRLSSTPTNLFDHYYVASCATGNIWCGFGAPRTVLLTLKYQLADRKVRPRDEHANASANGRWVHKWTSLICTVFLLMLCITGLPLIFQHEIDHLLHEEVEPAEVPAGTPQANLERWSRRGLRTHPGPGGAVHDLGPRRSERGVAVSRQAHRLRPDQEPLVRGRCPYGPVSRRAGFHGAG